MAAIPNDLVLLARHVVRDSRYPVEAYLFVREGLSFAADHFRLAEVHDDHASDHERKSVRARRHLTGQQLCEGLRLYAIAQYGMMCKTVLHSWGIHSTRDFGEIVYAMIRMRILKKSSRDRKSHFDNIYDFDTAFSNVDDIFCSPCLRCV
ncbi:MAG TPA: hypothetical protein PKD54_08025 [Pirellulaceae bacterium]|nr:hypothetical protein [Pirellulaceae bacterium]